MGLDKWNVKKRTEVLMCLIPVAHLLAFPKKEYAETIGM